MLYMDITSELALSDELRTSARICHLAIAFSHIFGDDPGPNMKPRYRAQDLMERENHSGKWRVSQSLKISMSCNEKRRPRGTIMHLPGLVAKPEANLSRSKALKCVLRKSSSEMTPPKSSAAALPH
jgi:hypothetical protein